MDARIQRDWGMTLAHPAARLRAALAERGSGGSPGELFGRCPLDRQKVPGNLPNSGMRPISGRGRPGAFRAERHSTARRCFRAGPGIPHRAPESSRKRRFLQGQTHRRGAIAGDCESRHSDAGKPFRRRSYLVRDPFACPEAYKILDTLPLEQFTLIQSHREHRVHRESIQTGPSP
jgi:hypothetical protein